MPLNNSIIWGFKGCTKEWYLFSILVHYLEAWLEGDRSPFAMLWSAFYISFGNFRVREHYAKTTALNNVVMLH